MVTCAECLNPAHDIVDKIRLRSADIRTCGTRFCSGVGGFRRWREVPTQKRIYCEMEGFGRVRMRGDMAFGGGWLRRQMRRWGFGRVRMRLVEICGGGRVETERVFGWSFLAEMLVGRYEGTRSPFFPPSLLPSFLPHLLTADMSNSYNRALVLPATLYQDHQNQECLISSTTAHLVHPQNNHLFLAPVTHYYLPVIQLLTLWAT